ncbi:MAG: GDSL family lipase [Burkholderiales bacterium]|nr:GDSL family lipase [Burkholderiales bacterium]
MAALWMRRALIVAACASSAWLVGCGSSVESAFAPQRVIAFGDSTAYLGDAAGMGRYTVDDGSVNNWTLTVAQDYGRSLASVAAGGLSYAQGNARISATPDAAGDPATPTVTQQIDTFLATQTVVPGDLALISAGTGDLIAGMAQVKAGTQTADEFKTQAIQAGKDLANQIKRLSDVGAHVVVTGVYRLGRTPWATAIGQEPLLTAVSDAFNDALKVELYNLNLSQNVRYAEIANYVNPLDTGGSYYVIFANMTTPVCNSVDAGAGIGIGPGEVNSALCTSATLVDANLNTYLFADKVYLTPEANRQVGREIYNFLRDTW